jgi:hypothetical protein
MWLSIFHSAWYRRLFPKNVILAPSALVDWLKRPSTGAAKSLHDFASPNLGQKQIQLAVAFKEGRHNGQTISFKFG